MECSRDDVLVHGKDQNEYVQNLEAVLKRPVKAETFFTKGTNGRGEGSNSKHLSRSNLTTHKFRTGSRGAGWRNGESARLLPMWSGFDSGPLLCVGWLCYVWFSPCSEDFSPCSPIFLTPQKPTPQIPIRPG